MNQVILPTKDSPENRIIIYKQALRSAREALLVAQDIVRPTDKRWKELDLIIAPIEEMLMRKV